MKDRESKHSLRDSQPLVHQDNQLSLNKVVQIQPNQVEERALEEVVQVKRGLLEQERDHSHLLNHHQRVEVLRFQDYVVF